MPDIRVPQYLEVVCISDRPRTFRDQALFEVGGTITFQPGERKKIPLAAFLRGMGRGYLRSAESHDLHESIRASQEKAAQEEAAAEEVAEKRKSGRRRQ